MVYLSDGCVGWCHGGLLLYSRGPVFWRRLFVRGSIFVRSELLATALSCRVMHYRGIVRGPSFGAVSIVCQGTALVRDLDCCIPGYIFLMCPLFYVFMFSFFSFFLFLQRELCRMTVVV